MELNLANKNVLVVGASKGIGKAICQGFAAEKSKIVAIARTKSLLEQLKTDCIKLEHLVLTMLWPMLWNETILILQRLFLRNSVISM